MEKVHFTMDGEEICVEAGTTILEAARTAGVHIPTLCYLKDYTEGSACRMCLVEVVGAKGPVTACNTKITEGMEVHTRTEEIQKLRKQNLRLIASNHRMDCTYCARFPHCELNALMREHGLDDREFRYCRPKEMDASAPHLVRDHSKCILCGRCVEACKKQGVCAIGFTGRGIGMSVTPGADFLLLSGTGCVGCGQCIQACPVGALREQDDTQQVLNELHHRKKHVWAGITHEAALTFGECMQDMPGASEEGKVVALLRELGFERVFCTGENTRRVLRKEALELQGRRERRECLPMISSKCPAIVTYIEKFYPDLTPLLSEAGNRKIYLADTCRRSKAEELGILPEDVYMVLITTCTADKMAAYENVDAALTVRELAALFKKSCVSDFTAQQVWKHMDSQPFDRLAEDEDEAAFDMDNVASSMQVSNISALKVLLDEIAVQQDGENKLPFEYLRCRACADGCMAGGGAPRVFAKKRDAGEYIRQRMHAMGVEE